MSAHRYGNVSAFIDGTAAAGDILRRETRAAIPVVVLGEFLCGIASSRHRARYEARPDANVAHFELLSIGEETARQYARLRLRLRLREAGKAIPANDTWIAALAFEHDLPVSTRDRHFRSVVGLRLRLW